MSRAADILNWVAEVDEALTPVAFTEDPKDGNDLNKASGYHYKGRYSGSDEEDGKDSRDLDGSKPAGVVSNAPGSKTVRQSRQMDGKDKGRMDTKLGKH